MRRRTLGRIASAFGVALVASTGCAAPLTPSPAARQAPGELRGVERTAREERAGRLQADRVVWVALDGKAPTAPVSATAAWTVDEQGGLQRLVRGTGGEAWRIEQKGGLLRLSGDGGDATPWRPGPFVSRPERSEALVQYAGKRYRGELWFTATDTGILVVNRLPVEDYLRGVVPLELGTRQPSDRAALEAQTIAARSYTYKRVPADSRAVPAAGWHMVATVMNQVYGGAEVEHRVVDDAVAATGGLVLRYNGVLVDAPYSSSCGGRTAVPREAWRDVRDEPYLLSVDDTDPASGRPYCDLSPRNHWVQEFDEANLREVVRRALATPSAAGARATATQVRGLQVAERTGSGRIGTFVIRTDAGDVTVRANELRSVFRSPRGAILSSTYFSVDHESRGAGHLTGVTLRGAGNGHGVGMCQWGAIGRARAGQDARTILRHYYPGTAVGFAD